MSSASTHGIQEPWQKVRFIELALSTIGVILLIVYLINYMNTGDWLWFSNAAIDAHPDRIIVYQDGEQTFIQPGHPHFLALSEAAHVAVSEYHNTNLIHVDFGEKAQAYYDTDGLLLEFQYNQPLDYKASFRVGDPTRLVVPIDGRHAGSHYFFRGDKEELWFGAMRMANPDQLYETLEALGYDDANS